MADLWEVPVQQSENVFMRDYSYLGNQPVHIELDGPWNTCPIDNAHHYSCFTLPGVTDGES